jgi:nucleotide-binding universal stress UspA family protein
LYLHIILLEDLKIAKILTAVDGSDHSRIAAEHAINLAEKYGSGLTALYVVSPDVRYGYLEDAVTPSLPGPLKAVVVLAMEQGQRYVDEIKQEASTKNIKIQTEVIIGSVSVSKAIVQYAEEQNIDLIVVGTRGISGIKKMLLGSTASGVVTHAHCPVLVVK